MRNAPSSAIALITAGMLFLVFGTPLRALWANAQVPWWFVYMFWLLGVIGLYVAERRRNHEQSSATKKREERDS